MDRKLMCVSNVRYKRPNAGNKVNGLLKYLTYRDSRNDYVRSASGTDRWVDHGLGKSVHEIAQTCDKIHSEHVLMFTLVINPNPDLMEMVPAPQREQFIRQLTERTVQSFFDARGIDTGVEYSYVVHHRQTDDEQVPGRANPHAHIILPGTFYDEFHGERCPLYFSRNKHENHIALLHEVTQQEIVPLLERDIGLNWEHRYDSLQQTREQQVQIAQEPPQVTDEIAPQRTLEPDLDIDW